MSTTIPRVRFLRQWRGFAKGTKSDKIGQGVASLLVQRGTCEWAAPLAQHVAAGRGKRAERKG